MYNLTNVTSSNNFAGMLGGINDLSGGLLFSVLMASVFIIVLLVFSNRDIKTVLLADSFIVTIIGIIGFTLGFIGWAALVIPIIVLLGSIGFYKFIDT